MIAGWMAKYLFMEMVMSILTLRREEMVFMSVALNTVIRYVWFINAAGAIRRAVDRGVYMFIVENMEKDARE